MPGTFPNLGNTLYMSPQPPPVAPRSGAAKVTVQSWQATSAPHGDESANYGNHVRCSSLDSVDSNGSSSSSGGGSHCRQLSNDREFIPTRTVGKSPTAPRNALQFVKVQSPLYKKAEHQIKLVREVKISKDTLKDGEEEWQSNLDNWKSRRRKASEKVIQRAEEMRQIEAEEQLRQFKEQQRKTKTFSEIIENKTYKRNYNLDLYVGQGDDSGVGGTPEPEDQDGPLDGQHSTIRSDTSEGMTSETDSIDSDLHTSERVTKEPPKVPKKPHSWLKRKESNGTVINRASPPNDLLHYCLTNKDHTNSGNVSSEPSDIEGHVADSENASSEDDVGYCCLVRNVDSGLESLCDSHRPNDTADSASDLSQDSGTDKISHNMDQDLQSCDDIDDIQRKRHLSRENCIKRQDTLEDCEDELQVRITTKQGLDAKGFNFSLEEEQNQETQSNVGIVISEISDVKEVKSSKKGASFAERLAIFSGGTSPAPNSTTPNSTKLNSTSQTTKVVKEDEVKRPSLVLRRRSTFEKNETDKEENINRRSSCVSSNINSVLRAKEERRHTIDFSTKCENIYENLSKKPPPPVPVKPRLRSKPYLQVNLQTDCCNSQISSPDNDQMSDTVAYGVDTTFMQDESSLQMQYPNKEEDICVNDEVFVSEYDDTEVHVNVKDILQETPGRQVEHNSILTSRKISEETYTSDVSASANIKQVRFSDDISKVVHKSIHDIENDLEQETISTVLDVENPQFDTCDGGTFPVETKGDVDSTEENVDVPFKSVIYLNDSSDNVSRIQIEPEECNSELNVLDVKQNDANSEVDACTLNYNLDDVRLHCSSEEMERLEILESEVSSVSREHFVQINVHHLDLPLPKIDEDDVVSASTTSSSETPDTETVIDNFPTNLSPLPNDDIVNNQVQSMERENVPLEDVSEPPEHLDIVSEKSSFQEQTSHISEDFTLSEEPTYEQSSTHGYALDTQEEEELYENELEESSDQLSPLDVIEQIELKLMQQLEQQALEDLSDDTNGELEEEVNRQLMYLSEDADLLDDLDAPRNVIPPSEPPPPPPPEPENVEIKVKTPFQRINSTKRIKKEIWRRRSDFLGLDSPETISVDDLPPPPPGLEELLKSEMEMQREQRLFLEKRMSLADSECAPEDATTYSPSEEYTSDYMLQVLDAEVYDAVANDEPQECESPDAEEDDFNQDDIEPEKEIIKQVESPQHKAKNHIQSLGAAPRAKIVDSNKWITQAEKHIPVMKQKSVDPLFREGTYNKNFWLAQEVGNRSMTDRVPAERRYSMPPAIGSRQPDVTVRAWDDREADYQVQPRPKSGIWNGRTATVAQPYSSYPQAGYYTGQNTVWTESTVNPYEDDKGSIAVNHQCSYCSEALTEGSAMGIDALQLYFHIECFKCCICQLQLGNGSCGTDVQVKNSQLYCPKCFTLD